ncbi:PREDICTED: uncharacterized protein LOC104768600 [Camelina sativa]|uniref:Uncharacterized protein LOC104768600 n=1 Tax=Camelina sativa TaxID=90675 RepID=A0ABM0XTQ0_CAMSA|nr:PREDICTED: uncharacterized protein LOC104768600 [Camelina sativa]XP_010490906.1 PREDICTED: uncharacterized protein LOC104768600 [Camelina sativa]XP_010490907.1 PREDICTED: uncharacterized protein LOC104768600 [Camelina sativa]
MSSLTVRRVSREDIQKVQNRIEWCLQRYMNQKEVVDFLLEKFKIEPGFTQLVWQKLEEENRDFFRAYYLRLKVKYQIMEYNELLEQQANYMRLIHPTRGASNQHRNGSHVPSMNQQQLWFGHKDSDQSSPHLSSAYLNGVSAINTNMPSYVDFSTNCRRVDPPPQNLLSAQATNMPLMQGMIKSETEYSNCAPYMYGGEAQSTVGDVSIASFSNESSSQSLNDPLVDADASTFGFLGQIPRNFSLSDLTADFSQSSEILESYDGSPFLLADAENFLDSSERVEHQGDHERLGTISEGFIYKNLGSK